MREQFEISDVFPFASQYKTIDGHRLHYIDEGKGDPILFLHGVPTSSYLWRNVIPHLTSHARCIAVDLIGMGKSDKPDIEYTLFDHIHYIAAFIESFKLKKWVFMLHGWGSVIGFHCAMKNETIMKGLACYESHLRSPTSEDMVALPVQEIAQLMNSDDGGYDVIMNSNYYVNKIMQSGVIRPLSAEALSHYQAPYDAPGSCAPIWQYLQELPLGEQDSPVVNLINTYEKWLKETPLPKLLFYAVPGFITPIETVKWAKENLSNLTLVDVGDALHYVQESNPHMMGQALSKWVNNL